MATTEQRSGFRLPWAAEARPIVPANSQMPPDSDPAPVAEGPTTADPTSSEATAMQEVTIPNRRDVAWPDADSRDSTADAEAPPDSAPAGEAPAREASAGEAPADGQPAPEAATTASTDAGRDGSARQRRENLLVTGLVRAMRDAATTAREETAARFAEEAKSRVETIQGQAADETAQLRKQADTEIVEIRDWSKAEMSRIREETDQRIADRKQHLETEIERHGALVEHRIARVEAAVADFERQMEAFFDRLMAEEDPARLAGLAEQLPDAPSLDLDELDRPMAGASATAFPIEALDARGAEAAEAAAFADLESADEVGDDLGEEPPDPIADDDVARRLDAFTGHGTTDDDGVTSKLAVVGLVSVASIAGFKRALARTPGVRSVTVASGPSGDFVFTLSHDPETDLRSIVPTLDGFAAQVTGDADGVLTVTASDPDGAH